MLIQLFGLDENGLQVYECNISKPNEASDVAKNILEGMSHIASVVAIENVPNISRYDDSSFHISYRSRFMFIQKREEK
jgi:hypothetical protein